MAVISGKAGSLLRRLTSRARPEIVALLDEAAAARLLNDAGPRPRFRHELVRAVLEQALGPADWRSRPALPGHG